MRSSRRCLLPSFAVAVILSSSSSVRAAPPKPGAPTTTKAAAHAASPTKAVTSGAKTSKISQDANVRRQVAGGPTLDDTSVGADPPEPRALHAAGRELFPPASPALGTPW